ncbi:MAG: MBL fold metallo-hydrolase [Brevundimonas sp.]|nr:MBL fold metallo-hydrolase [Brevundimonas sp.]MDO9609541.1 MBL fold metallo-hydrolase [Brevundimonas sp.]
MLEIHPLLVRNGARTMLFDTGLGAGKGQLMQSLQTAGVDPASITDVMISHGHPDHVGGLVADGALAFPNAAIRMSEAEWASMRANPEMADLVRVITPNVQAFRPGEEVAPGVEAQDTAGHTPGHVAYLIADGQNQLLYTGDLMHHWVLSVEHPDWTVGYDNDPVAGKKARLDEITALRASGAHIYAYHFPFPGLGKIQTREGRAMFISEAQPAA